ncbi:MAG: hypothetical protein QGG42_08620 [Phycisphaerae bacterium]|jgi:hypothetical protein|nr:hypothetical protein [Phycisphaerae bacterium]
MKALWSFLTIIALILPAGRTLAAEKGLITTTFGNAPHCEHRGTLKASRQALQFDLSAVAGKNIIRAVLRTDTRGHRHGAEVRVTPVGVAGEKPLLLRPPDYVTFDAAEAVGAWTADAKSNLGLRIEADGGVRFDQAVLEVSYLGTIKKPLRQVTQLRAVHQSGQTFLTWREIEDVVGADAPAFEAFDQAILRARAKRRVAYRIYVHTKPITSGTIAQARLAIEIPAVTPAWNLLAIRNTEHPNQGTKTKRSPLRPGRNLALNHVMTRYRITPNGPPLPRATGLAVSTAAKLARLYYAVSTAVDGREAVGSFGGAALTKPVDEKPARFPALIHQRSRKDPRGGQCVVDVYSAWLSPPYHNVPHVSEVFVARWKDTPPGTPKRKLGLFVKQTTHGGSATEMSNPGWHRARRHLKGVLTVGLAEGGMWQGFHECIGTLGSYKQGVVHNYPQRRVLSAAAWALSRKDLHLDPQRTYIWGQMAHWALRHGDVFSVVMSNGYGNIAIGKEAQKHGWKWGPYPKGSKNWRGVDQWEYMNLAKWVRRNPTVELPYWLCWPAYGAYPSHTIGDFGFMPWPEMIHAMASTKRAFAANWSSNGPGGVRPLRDLVTRIRRDQALPAFGNCSLDHTPGDGDHTDAEKGGGINLYQIWQPETLLDEPDKFEITVSLRDNCPAETCTTDLTPRRCRKFKAKAGQRFAWTHSNAKDAKPFQSGRAVADKWGLVTVKNLRLGKQKSRLTIRRTE